MQTSGYLFIWHESITALQPDGGPGNCCVLEDFPQWNTAVLLGVTTIPSIIPGAGERKGGGGFHLDFTCFVFSIFHPLLQHLRCHLGPCNPTHQANQRAISMHKGFAEQGAGITEEAQSLF